MNQTHQTRSTRRWFSDGATMAYSRRARTIYWAVNLILFALLNMFDLRIRIGQWIRLAGPFDKIESLIPSLLDPLNIFQYPTQIIVIGTLMALISTVPILIALLYNWWHGLPFALVVYVVGQNPILSLCILVSCTAASFDPFRFKSKFVASVMCLIPVIFYWAIFSGENPEENALRWAVLYAPWGVALFNSLCILGLVLAIGHFLRYRPGALMPLFGLFLAATVAFFHFTIGMTERDFRAEVYSNSPARLPALQSRSIVPMLQEERDLRRKKEPYLNPDAIENELRIQWRWAFFSIEPAARSTSALANEEVAQFYIAKHNAIKQIDAFIQKVGPQGDKIADALYYKALLLDLNIDPRALRYEDTLRFYYDMPTLLSEKIWQTILDDYPDAHVAIEARWRLALLMAGHNLQPIAKTSHFDKAVQLLTQAQKRAERLIEKRKNEINLTPSRPHWFSQIFTSPEPTLTMDNFVSLTKRTGRLIRLLDKENRPGTDERNQRLADFIALNPHMLNYEEWLKEMKLNSPPGDPLIDNIELAEVLLIEDIDERILRLTDLVKKYPKKDAGVEAMLELALLLLKQRERSEHLADRQMLLSRSHEYLQDISALRTGTSIALMAKEILEKNPIE